MFKVRCCGHPLVTAFCPHCGKSVQPKLRPGEPLYWDRDNDCYTYQPEIEPSPPSPPRRQFTG